MFVLLISGSLFAAEEPVRGDIAVFYVPQANIQLRALSDQSVSAVADECRALGRLMPVETGRRDSAFQSVVKSAADPYDMAARNLGARIYAVIYVYRMGDTVYARMKVVPLDSELKHLKRDLSVRSRIMVNIPLKLARETVYLHRDLALRVPVREKRGSLYLVDAGQWHGVRAGPYKTTMGRDLLFVKTGRYRSLARLPEGADARGIVLRLYPDVKSRVSKIERRIDKNTVYRFGLGNTLLRGTDPERRLIEGLCVINIGSNACVPGYGAFLSTDYLGFRNKSASLGGVLFSSAAIAAQLSLTEFMTGFRTNFFPWVRDSDKSGRIQDLQVFLWASLPLTFSSAYMDQIAFQLKGSGLLPPFFMTRNETAAVMSLVIPGGGHFYKGYRLTGWAYYVAEMACAGYGVYHMGDARSIQAFAILGIVKCADVVHAWFSEPAYTTYRFERERRMRRGSLSFNMRPSESGVPVFCMSFQYRY